MSRINGFGDAGTIAEALIPDFWDMTSCGLYGCFLTYHDPIHDRRVWACGLAAGRIEAREIAVQNMTNEIMQGQVTPIWFPT